MSITNTGNNIRKAIVAGSYTSSTLNTLLGDANMLSSFKHMLNSDFSAQLLFQSASTFDVIFNSTRAWDAVLKSEVSIKGILKSELATKIISSSSVYLQEILNNTDFMNIYKSNNAYKVLRNHVNKSYSKLKREIFRASGNFTPANNIALLSAILVGAGGDGGFGNVSSIPNPIPGSGGGGGEIICVKLSSISPSTYSLIVAAASNTSLTIGSTYTAHKGATGFTVGGGSSGLGGGTTTNNGIQALTDYDLLNSAWQDTAFTQQGGQGENVAGGSFYRSHGYFKELGGVHSGSAKGQSSGGFGGGGRSNSTTSTNQIDPENGESGTGNGGGAAPNGVSGASAGTGASGIIIIHYVEA